MIECPKCSDTFNRESDMKRHHAHKHGESISGFSTECHFCGSSVVKEEKNQAEGRSFCDKVCLNQWQLETSENELENSPTWQGKQTDTDCCVCGDTFSHPTCRDRVTCSYECLSVMQSERYKGENNPNWSGGHVKYYGRDWPKMKRWARDKYGNICQHCGKDANRVIPVHHIKPVKEFDDPNDAHYKQNLTQVCWTCHQKVEKLSEDTQIEKLK